ncbi:hypothetical protein PX666_14505 [Acinetobacter baumannii]|nr:hypothetical protein PX666_14505 [Acinetobacter baumannii]
MASRSLAVRNTHALAKAGFITIRNLLEGRVEGGSAAALALAEALHNLPEPGTRSCKAHAGSVAGVHRELSALGAHAQFRRRKAGADSMKVETRQRIERQIARKAAKDLIAAGYKVAVFDGEEIALEASTDVRAIMAAMFSTDEDYLFAMTPGEDGKMKRAGWVRFIYGNMGFDVINDYTTNLEGALAETNALADQLETRHG